MFTLITFVFWVIAIITENVIVSYGLMIWFLFVGLKGILYIFQWYKKNRIYHTTKSQTKKII